MPDPNRTGHTLMSDLDIDKALSYALSISYPRLIGSDGEGKAAKQISEIFRKIGLKVIEEKFYFNSDLNVASKLPIATSLILVCVSPFLVRCSVLITLVVGMILILGLSLSGSLIRRILWNSVSPLYDSAQHTGSQSQNILAYFQEAAEDFNSYLSPARQHKTILLVAHYDSKSQNIALPYRILLIALFIFSVFLLGTYLVVLSFGQKGFEVGFEILVAVAIISGIAILFIRNGNASPGAIDNASSIGLLLCLAEAIFRNREDFRDLNIVFLATGAEEVGLAGAIAFCKSHLGKKFPPNRDFFVINLDGVGGGESIYATSSIGILPRFKAVSRQFQDKSIDGTPQLLKIAKEVAREANLNLKICYLVIGAMADHFPFRDIGLDAITLASYSRKSWVIHSSKDTTDKLDRNGIELSGKLVLKIIEQIEKMEASFKC